MLCKSKDEHKRHAVISPLVRLVAKYVDCLPSCLPNICKENGATTIDAPVRDRYLRGGLAYPASRECRMDESEAKHGLEIAYYRVAGFTLLSTLVSWCIKIGLSNTAYNKNNLIPIPIGRSAVPQYIRTPSPAVERDPGIAVI